MNCFAQWQSEYASRGVAIFPVRIVGNDKRPAVRNYLRTGLQGSERLTRRFANADAFGFALGKRSKITVLDCDSNDERILSDAMSRHGNTPLVVRSGSGNFQAWYRHGGEGRHIRPDPSRPIDILGGGFVVAPPSRGAKLQYQIISGSLDDLGQLPALQNFKAALTGSNIDAGSIGIGQRNAALFRHCMKHAPACDDFPQLLDVAETFVAECCEIRRGHPVTPDEIAKTARSVWLITERGENRFSDHAAVLSVAEANQFIRFPECLGFLAWLKAQNGPDATFMIADGLAPTIGFSRDLLRRCRRQLRETGIIHMVSAAKPGVAAFYRWGNGLAKAAPQSGSGGLLRIGGSVDEDRGRISACLTGRVAA
jgi:hypothetical protein